VRHIADAYTVSMEDLVDEVDVALDRD